MAVKKLPPLPFQPVAWMYDRRYGSGLTFDAAQAARCLKTAQESVAWADDPLTPPMPLYAERDVVQLVTDLALLVGRLAHRTNPELKKVAKQFLRDNKLTPSVLRKKAP